MRGVVQGLVDHRPRVTVTIGSANGLDTVLEATEVDSDGSFEFRGLTKQPYWIKHEGAGYAAKPSEVIQPPPCANDPMQLENAQVNVTIVAHTPDSLRGTRRELSGSTAFRYVWQEDASRAGIAETAHIVDPPNVTFLGERIEMGDDQAADKLRHEFNILVESSEVKWSSEFTFRLYETLSSIPQRQTRDFYSGQSLPPSKWTLTNDFLDEDISIVDVEAEGGEAEGGGAGGGARVVRISRAAFVHASPQVVRLNGERGKFFSRRLHHAAVRFVTHEGRDTDAVQHIMSTRYGCTTGMSDSLYASLTASTTGEDATAFQPFERHVEEPLLLLTMLEEMPEGMHVVPGLDYMLRRLDGHPHPWYPGAAAVAWTGSRYIEFMERGMTRDLRGTRRLILHEKAHFLWAHVLSDELKASWITIGGWYECVNATSGWCSTSGTAFVSPYGHLINPNEDMAESIAHYVENPATLLACCPEKFALIRDRVMQGYRYISRVRPDLTFQVLNLLPDYTYPGKIVRVAIELAGAPHEDKTCTVMIELHTLGGVFDGASRGSFRLFSEIGTYMDVHLSPTDGSESANTLSSTFTISRYAKQGLWRPQQIQLRDLAGNKRFAGVDDFGWRLFVESPLEDVTPPRYVDGSLTLELRNGIHQGHKVQWADVSWLVIEQRGVQSWGGAHSRLVNDDPRHRAEMQTRGYNTLRDATNECGDIPSGWLCQRAATSHLITDFRPSANYWVSYISMEDVAMNSAGQSFIQHDHLGSGLLPESPQVFANTSSADGQPPEVDLGRISVSAVPTNPSAPNGETRVTIVYYARDDKSGLGQVAYTLLDPQGTPHREYHYHRNARTEFFEGNPAAWERYEIVTILPVGSHPGTWGLASLELSDKVDNHNQQSFVENLHFQLEGEEGAGGRRLEWKPKMEHLRFELDST